MEHAIQTTALNKSFNGGKLEIIKNLDFTLGRGRFEAVMGPSGSGKSTFLHLLAGLLKADSGTIKIGGEDITSLSDRKMTVFRRRKIGLIFQDFNLVETLTAEENIMLPNLLDGEEPDKGLLRDVISTLGLEYCRSNLPARLSGGERQRVAIARALITNPAVILADEPTGNLDFPSGREFCVILSEINKATNCAILLVSHDPVIAAHTEKVHILKDGRITKSFDSNHNPENIATQYIAAM